VEKVKFSCFNCEAKLEVDEKYIGRKGRCPTCGAKNTIPSPQDTLEESIIALFKDIDEYEEEIIDNEEDEKDEEIRLL
jgi:DNA-directed RNA polymerase subunit RPC12/RpoP